MASGGYPLAVMCVLLVAVAPLAVEHGGYPLAVMCVLLVAVAPLAVEHGL